MNELSEHIERRIQEQIHFYEKKAIETRWISLVLRLAHLICLLLVPLLIFSVPERSLTMTIAGILAMISVIASITLQAFRFEARWELMVSAIQELNRLRFEIQTRVSESPDELQKDIAKVAEATAKVEAAMMLSGLQP